MSTTPMIGIVSAPALVPVLHALGFTVLSDEQFRPAARLVSEAISSGSKLPVVVGDAVEPGLRPWAASTGLRTRVVVLGLANGAGAQEGEENRLELPATINDLFDKLGFQHAIHVGDFVITPAGEIYDPTQAAPVQPERTHPVAAPAPQPLPVPQAPVTLPVVDQAPLAQVTPGVRLPEPAISSRAHDELPDDLFIQPQCAPNAAARLEGTPPDAPSTSGELPDDLFLPTVAHTSPVPVPAEAYTPASTALPRDDQITEPATAPVLPVIALTQERTPAVAERTDPTPSIWRDERPAQVAELPAHLDPRFAHHQPFPEAPSPSQWGSSDETEEDPDLARDLSYVSPLPVVTPRDDRSYPQPTYPRPASRIAPLETPRQVHGRRGDVIISWAPKGGVGKSTIAILLAARAAELSMTCVVVDANRGQADLKKYLRLGDAANLRTAYAAYESGRAEDAILRPNDYATLRLQAKLPVPEFAIVLGPPAALADPAYVSADVYADIVEQARAMADLVIIDTQILEAHRTDLWDELLVPLMRSGAWNVGIIDESVAAVSNLSERLEELTAAGVPNGRTMILPQMYENFTSDDAAYFQQKFGRFGTLVGSTAFDIDFKDALNTGRIDPSSPAIGPALNAILARVTGRPEIAAPPVKKRRGIFGGRR